MSPGYSGVPYILGRYSCIWSGSLARGAITSSLDSISCLFKRFDRALFVQLILIRNRDKIFIDNTLEKRERLCLMLAGSMNVSRLERCKRSIATGATAKSWAQSSKSLTLCA